MTQDNTPPVTGVTPEQAAREYTFTLTFVEACRVVDAIKRQPMNQVEDLVQKLDTQYKAQKAVEDEEAAKLVKEPVAITRVKATRKKANA